MTLIVPLPMWLLSRNTKLLIDKFKQLKRGEQELEDSFGSRCSETKTELDSPSTDDMSDGSFSPNKHKRNSWKANSNDIDDELNENIPLISLRKSNKRKAKRRPACGAAPNASSRPHGSPAQSISRSSDSLTVNRKRVRIILSDDEGESDEDRSPVEGIGTSDECKL